MSVIAIINQKGGVGKTTNTIHIGAHFANSNKKVLLIDFDPQCDLSHGVGVDVGEDYYDVVDFLKGTDELSFEEVQENLWLLPGNKYFVASLFKKNDLKIQLDAIKGVFDYILIDCPPTTINHIDIVQGDLALLGSDYFLVPVEADEYPIKNLNVFLGSVFKLIEDNNLSLNFAGVFFSNVLVTKNAFKYYSNILKEKGIDEYLFKTYIRQDAKVQQAVKEGLTIFNYSPNCRASLDFKELGEELLSRINQQE